MDAKDAAFGTGNVFEDLNLPEPEVLLRKADLASAILSYLERDPADSQHAATSSGLASESLMRMRSGDLDELRVAELEDALARIRAVEHGRMRPERTTSRFGLG
ncbi:hypothetical protein [Salinarimonas rosea]|uniref:hypothetical protein n=1 Tax=Salinarimonas rosea TaxID=552063 RepID=UPI0003FFB471|nr:hypothetical protein [Salinarimonas rosea]